MGGRTRAFAIDSKGEDPTGDEDDDDMGNAVESVRRRFEGVGSPGGSLAWTTEERSSRAAAGEVKGRK